MRNLLKLATLASFCFAMIVFGACGGGSGGGQGGYQGGGGYTVTVNGTAYSASGTVGGTAQYTVTNGLTYFRTGTDTTWQVCDPNQGGCSGHGSTTSTHTSI